MAYTFSPAWPRTSYLGQPLTAETGCSSSNSSAHFQPQWQRAHGTDVCFGRMVDLRSHHRCFYCRGCVKSCTWLSASAQPQNSTATSAGSGRRLYDVIALSNLCVDIVIPVAELPPPDDEARRQLLRQLTATPPHQSMWEVGGNSNFLLAAARLGLRVASLGHLGSDVYGKFLEEILLGEGVQVIEPIAADVALADTLLCFVLVDPASRHAFCSRYDFGPWPLLQGVTTLSPTVRQMLLETEALFLNGFVFDDLPTQLVMSAALSVRAAGAAVFFDPGPRAWTLLKGERRAALEAVLDVSDVVLMTQEEAEAVTGCSEAAAAGRAILSRPGAATEWCIVKQGAAGALLCSKSHSHSFHFDALKVDVRDTVGCGDSFAAAVVLGYTRQHDLAATMALANAVGAATATGSGAGRNVASAALVMQLLAEQAQAGNGAGGIMRSASSEAINVLQQSLDEADFLAVEAQAAAGQTIDFAH